MSWDKMPDDVRQAAKELAGNWQKFESFGWYSEPKGRPEDCAIVYLSNRDSGPLDKSNEAAILAELKPWIGSIDDGALIETQSHNHWAVGYVDGIVIRCLDAAGEPTPAFVKLHELAQKLAEYPILDDDDFSDREQAEEFECWQAFGASDFRGELVKLMPHHEELFARVSDDHLLRVWYDLAPGGEASIHESGGCHFTFSSRFGKRAGMCAASASDVRQAFLSVAADDRRYGTRKAKKSESTGAEAV